jgi:hypothetical protein
VEPDRREYGGRGWGGGRGSGREEGGGRGEGRYAMYEQGEIYIYKYTHTEPEVNIRRNCTEADCTTYTTKIFLSPFFTLTYWSHFLTSRKYLLRYILALKFSS